MSIAPNMGGVNSVLFDPVNASSKNTKMGKNSYKNKLDQKSKSASYKK